MIDTESGASLCTVPSESARLNNCGIQWIQHLYGCCCSASWCCRRLWLDWLIAPDRPHLGHDLLILPNHHYSNIIVVALIFRYCVDIYRKSVFHFLHRINPKVSSIFSPKYCWTIDWEWYFNIVGTSIDWIMRTWCQLMYNFLTPRNWEAEISIELKSNVNRFWWSCMNLCCW